MDNNDPAPNTTGASKLTADGIHVVAPATTTTNTTAVQINCSCGGIMSPIAVSITDIPPGGGLGTTTTPLLPGLTCGSTIQVNTPTVGHFYTVRAAMTCDGVPFSDSATIERQ